jgi:TatD DNase family protein
MIDTHCHLNFDHYDEDREAVVARAAEAGVRRIINPGIDRQSNLAALNLAARYEGIFAAVGIHPNSTAEFDRPVLDEVAELALRPGVVAIGEIGLDYYRDKSPKKKQMAAFEAQLALAARLELPVIIHNRKASEDIIFVLEAWANALPSTLEHRPGVLHSFSASMEIAERALRIGFYLGFTGPITFKTADDLRRIAASIPPERILVETDGPFLTPEPYRGKRNEPGYIPYIVERLAVLHGVTFEAMAQQTTDNAVKLFDLPDVQKNSAPQAPRRC